MGESLGRKRKGGNLMSQENQNTAKRGKNLKKLLNEIRPAGDHKELKRLNGKLSHRKPRTVLSWLIDMNVVLPMARVYYRNKAGIPLMKGKITRDGILCDCCSRVFALTAFEAHAGSTNHRPAAFIMLDDGSGRSLSDCQKQARDSTNSIIKVPKVQTAAPDHENQHQQRDGICSLCLNGGDLIFCNQCPSGFHMKCLGLKEVPKGGHWFCRSCCCGICGSGHLVEGCSYTCQQCERQFHAICLRMKTKSSDHWKNYYQTEGKSWFCSRGCERVFYGLQNLRGRSIPVGNNLSWTLLKADDQDEGSAENIIDENNQSKLNAALDVMHECFHPSKDFYTGRDVTEDVIFSRGSKLKRLDFKGFYTVIVEENGEVATAATVRVYGNKVAELPLVATRFRHRRRGMCRVLVNALERILRNLGVETLILPSVSSTLDTWTSNFEFTKMTDEDLSKFFQFTFLDFPETVMCHKQLLKS